MSKDFINEVKKRAITYLDENFPTTEEGRLYKKAKKRVKKKKDFYVHVMVFIPVNIFLAGIAIFLTPEVWWWFLISLAGWSFGLIAHYMDVFGFPGVGRFDDGWEAYQIEKEYRKLRREKEFEEYLKKPLPERLEEERLELKDLEKRYREDDLV